MIATNDHKRRAIPWLIILLSLGMAGCAEMPPTMSDPEACAAASAHLRACLETPAPPGSDGLLEGPCDSDAARDLLAMNCNEVYLSAVDRKSDSFTSYLAEWGCEAGLYALCDVPQCNAADDEALVPRAQAPEREVEASNELGPCAQEALTFAGCGACSFYECVEETFACGPTGYLMGFGNEYCLRFRLLTEPVIGPKAAAWMARVRGCLIKELDQALPLESCDELQAAADESHLSCYIDEGFCDLSASDMWKIMVTISPSDIALKNLFDFGHDCIDEWTED